MFNMQKNPRLPSCELAKPMLTGLTKDQANKMKQPESSIDQISHRLA